MKRIYLDNAATTKLDKHALKEMLPFLKENFGNPSAIYQEGVVASRAVQQARKSIASTLQAPNHKVFFTGSGTESDNLAILGIVDATAPFITVGKPHIITSVIEHAAVLDVVKKLEEKGKIKATYIPVNKNGIVSIADIKNALRENTVLVSVMYANNEIGTIQPIKEIARVVEEFRRVQKTAYPYIHTDACQAVNYLDVSMEKLGVDLFVFNGSKIYGPKGIGVLCVRKGVEMVPMVFGGGQEDGLRSGTENVAYIVGLAKALEITENIKEKEVKRLTVLRDHFINKLLESIPQAVLNGDREARLPNNVHITIPDVEDDVLVVELDARGVACSSKSACKASSGEGSHVTLAIDGIEGSHLRFSLGRDTVKKDVEYVTRAISHILKKYKKL